ncbi:hypothetical protein VNO77_42954 [Canavalia gladiata]|uniref:Uncharacterized protein n=1 Tax=Canavalia gladiata TaxID=3824 RepID=A0AAN9JT76_CANGL
MARKSTQESKVLISSSETATDEDLAEKKKRVTSSNSRGKKQKSLSNSMKPPLASIAKNKGPSTSSLGKRKEKLSSEETVTEDLIEKKQASNFVTENLIEKKQASNSLKNEDLIEKQQASSSLKEEKELKTKSNKRGRPAGDSWKINWIMRPTTRASNGRIDKSYIHKVEPIICRSVKEVERYESHGILPSRYKNTNAKDKTIEKSGGKEQTKEKDAKKKGKEPHIEDH